MMKSDLASYSAYSISTYHQPPSIYELSWERLWSWAVLLSYFRTFSSMLPASAWRLGTERLRDDVGWPAHSSSSTI